jgi:hypothetical protein
MPVPGSLDDLVGDVAAGPTEKDDLLRSSVHHVEQGLEAHDRIALRNTNIN